MNQFGISSKMATTMVETIQVFKYKIISELPITELGNRFAAHSRLRVFASKGTTCVCCGKVGTRLIKGEDRGGGKHWDVYTSDLFPLTIDHIVPKSLGGSNHIDNLQPMCSACNTAKGNGKHNRPSRQKPTPGPHVPSTLQPCLQLQVVNLVGKCAWRRQGKSRKLMPLGVIAELIPNPHTGKISAKIIHKKESFFHLEGLYVDVV